MGSRYENVVPPAVLRPEVEQDDAKLVVPAIGRRMDEGCHDQSATTSRRKTEFPDVVLPIACPPMTAVTFVP